MNERFLHQVLGLLVVSQVAPAQCIHPGCISFIQLIFRQSVSLGAAPGQFLPVQIRIHLQRHCPITKIDCSTNFCHIYTKNLRIRLHLHHYLHHGERKRRQPLSKLSPCAVGESRTHTPQRALPPQSSVSVSTISPLPRIGTAKIRQKSETANYFSTLFL